MKTALSLRLRLMALILTPLIVIAALSAWWRFAAAHADAEALFDRTLMALTLAISRDVAVSDGDALSPATLALMHEASGGAVFYHAHGPDGVYLTGYAYPPVAPPKARTALEAASGAPVFYDAQYRGAPVRVARLKELVSAAGLTGYATVTVWRDKSARVAFARRLALRTAAAVSLLVATAAAMIWVGVNLGLKPLTDLEASIARRSPDDLSPIRRPAPHEAQGMLDALNRLFAQVSQALAARDAFISDAAHQLRNPVAGVAAMAEAAQAARTDADRRDRINAMVDAARHAARLTRQLLSYERAKGRAASACFERLDLNALAQDVCARGAERVLARGLTFAFNAAPEPLWVKGDAVLLAEAIENLLDNALAHGGPGNTSIVVSAASAERMAQVTVADTGAGLPWSARARVFERFVQINPSEEGCGLGLAIIQEIAVCHGGAVSLVPTPQGASFRLDIPAAL